MILTHLLFFFPNIGGTPTPPEPPEPPVVRPPRSTGGYAMPIPTEVVDPYEQIRLQDDKELVDIINILMATGVFHGKPH